MGKRKKAKRHKRRMCPVMSGSLVRGGRVDCKAAQCAWWYGPRARCVVFLAGVHGAALLSDRGLWLDKKGFLVRLANEGDPRRCRVCGCTDATPCMGSEGPCSWVEEDLCSGCSPEAEGEA